MTGVLSPPAPRSRPELRHFGLPPRRIGLWVAVGMAALGVRLLYIFVIARAPVGIGGDAGFYHTAAGLIADGRFYYREILSQVSKTAEHPPLYPLVLSLSSVLGAKTLLAHRIVGCVIGAITVVLIGLLAERVAGRRAGIIASAIAALYPPFVTADGLVMSEPLFTATVAAALLVALRLRARPSVSAALLLGATIALTALTRAEGLLLLPLLGWPASFARAPGTLSRLLAVSMATIVVIAPWVIHNAVVFHRMTFSTNENTLIAGANCRDTYYGRDIGWWSLDCFERSQSHAQVFTGDASTGTALRYARDHLGRVPLVMAARVLRTFDFLQPLRQGNRELRRRWVDVVGVVFYYLLLLLAAVGLALVARSRDRGARRVLPRGELALLLAPVWMVVLTSALGWGIGRFRIAADITIVVLAALALAAAKGLRAARDERGQKSMSHIKF